MVLYVYLQCEGWTAWPRPAHLHWAHWCLLLQQGPSQGQLIHSKHVFFYCWYLTVTLHFIGSTRTGTDREILFENRGLTHLKHTTQKYQSKPALMLSPASVRVHICYNTILCFYWDCPEVWKMFLLHCQKCCVQFFVKDSKRKVITSQMFLLHLHVKGPRRRGEYCGAHYEKLVEM